MMRKIWNTQQRWQATSCVPLRERIKGFTRIELLVVTIATVGLLATMSVAGVEIVRIKGVKTAAQNLDANFYHNLGDSMVLQVLMDEGLPSCVGAITSVKDSSGYGRGFTISSPAPTWSTDTPFGAGCSLTQSRTTSVWLTQAGVVNPPRMSAFAWVKSTLNTDWLWSFIICNNGGNGKEPYCFDNGFNTIRILLATTGGAVDLQAPQEIMQLNKWYFVGFSYDGSTVRLYKDGVSVASSTMIGTISQYPGAHTFLGSPNAGMSTQGNIDNVRIYDRALDTSEIQKLYAMDAPKHGIAFVGGYWPLR